MRTDRSVSIGGPINDIEITQDVEHVRFLNVIKRENISYWYGYCVLDLS